MQQAQSQADWIEDRIKQIFYSMKVIEEIQEEGKEDKSKKTEPKGRNVVKKTNESLRLSTDLSPTKPAMAIH